MAVIKYTDLLDPSYKFPLPMHENAHWTAVGIGDVVEVPELFTFKVIFWDVIKEAAKQRAIELGARMQYRFPGPENTETQIRFYVEESVGGGAVSYPTPPTHPISPGHRGSYYGPEEGVFPLPGWNLISLPSKYTQDETTNVNVGDKYYDL